MIVARKRVFYVRLLVGLLLKYWLKYRTTSRYVWILSHGSTTTTKPTGFSAYVVVVCWSSTTSSIGDCPKMLYTSEMASFPTTVIIAMNSWIVSRYHHGYSHQAATAQTCCRCSGWSNHGSRLLGTAGNEHYHLKNSNHQGSTRETLGGKH